MIRSMDLSFTGLYLKNSLCKVHLPSPGHGITLFCLSSPLPPTIIEGVNEMKIRHEKMYEILDDLVLDIMQPSC